MTRKSFDPIGRKIGRLTVLHEGERHRTKRGIPVRTWMCQCDCGKIVKKLYSQFYETRHDISCGCARAEKTIERCTTHGCASPKNRTPEYNSWRAMQTRCSNGRQPGWKNYGGRGITVCEKWQDFPAFFADMGPKPSPAHSIDRIDNDGNYEPGNCRWATRSEQYQNSRQTMNKRNNRFFTHDGKTQILADWARSCGVTKATIRERLERGWSLERALTSPATPVRRWSA